MDGCCKQGHESGGTGKKDGRRQKTITGISRFFLVACHDFFKIYPMTPTFTSHLNLRLLEKKKKPETLDTPLMMEKNDCSDPR